MAASLEELRSKLAENPLDLDTLGRLEAECVRSKDFEALQQGYALVLAATSSSAGVTELIGRLAAVAENAGSDNASPREGLELLLRAARLYARAPLSDRSAAARALATAWSIAPDPRVLDAVGNLMGNPDLVHAPEFLTFAHAQLVAEQGPAGERAFDALHVLAGRHLDRLELNASRRLYDQLVELRPQDARVREGLAALDKAESERQEAYEKAVQIAEATVDDERAETRAWVDVGLAAARIGRDEAAIEAYQKARERGGEDGRLETLETRIRAQKGGVDALVALWSTELSDLGSASLGSNVESRAIALRRKLFRALTDLGRHDEAQKLLTLERTVSTPTPTEALEQARELEEQGEPQAALDLLSVAERTSPAGRAVDAVVAEQARLLDQVMGDPDAAEPLYRRVRLANPKDLKALRFFRRFYGFKGDESANDAYGALAQLYAALPRDDDHRVERTEVAAEMARAARIAFDAPERAHDAWRRVVSEDPKHDEANEALREAYAQAERWHLLVEHLEAWAKALEGDPESAVEKLFEVLEIYQDPTKLDQDELVVPTYRRIVALSPTSVVALDRLARRYEDDHKWRELIKVLKKKVEVSEDTAELLKLFTKISALYLERIDSPAEAIEWLERLLDLDPGNLEIMQTLRDVYTRKHDIERLYETYKRELELLDGTARRDVLVELGEIATNQLFKHTDAVAHWRAVLEIDPKHERATAALGELHAEQEDWVSYAALLKSKIEDAATRKEKVEFLQELGEVAYARLDDEERARKIFTEICEISPFNTKARRFLQNIYVSRRAWTELRALYAPRDDWKGYVALLTDFAQRAEDLPLKADIHVEIADIHSEKTGEARRTISSLEHALEAASERVDVARRLLELYPASTPVAKRFTAMEAIARNVQDEATSSDAYRQLAELRTEHHDQRGAFGAWSGALTAGAAIGDVSALDPLQEICEKLSIHNDLANLLSEALARLPDDALDARRIVHRTLAHLSRAKLMDTDRATAHYACLLQISPADEEALAALEEMYLAAGNFEGVEEVLRARAELASNEEERLDATLRLGELYDEALADAERAAECYEAILRARPNDQDVLDRLRETLAGAEAWSALARSLEMLVVRVESLPQVAKVRLELAKLYADQLGDPEAAVEEYRVLLALDPMPEEDSIVEALEAFFATETSTEACVPLLEKLYRRRGDVAKLVKVLEVKEGTLANDEERIAVLDELALLASTVVDDPRLALKAQIRRFRIKPADIATWNELESLADRCDGAHGLIASRWDEVLERSGPDTDEPVLGDPELRNALRRRLARLFEKRLSGAPEPQIRLYEAILAEGSVEEDLTDVYDRLEHLYDAKDELAKLIDIRLQAAERVRSPVARRQKLLDAANVMATRMGRRDEAVTLYERLAEADPSDEEATRKLEGLYQEFGKFESLAKLLQKRVEVLDGKRRDEQQYRLAMLLVSKLEDYGGACRELSALVLSPSVGAAARASILKLAQNEAFDDAQLTDALRALDSYHESVDDPQGKADVVMLHAQQAKKGQPRARILRQAASLLTTYAYAENERLVAAAEQVSASEEAVEVVDAEMLTDDDIANAANILDDESLQIVQAETEHGAVKTEAHSPMLPEIRAVVDRAFSIYARALQEYPGDRETASAIEELAGRLNVWEKFARLMASAASKATVPAVRYELLEREARAAETHLQDPRRAIRAYHAIMEHAKASSKEALRALDALDRLHGETGDLEGRIRVLRMKRAAVKKPTLRLPLLREEARLFHSMGRHDEAAVALKAILQATASTQHTELLDARKGAQQHYAVILREQSSLDALMELLEQGAEEYIERDPDEAAARLSMAAKVALNELELSDKAIALYERIRSFRHGDPEALEALDELYQKAQRWDDKASVLEERIAHLPDDEAHSTAIRTARFTLAQLLEHRLGQPERSQTVYREVLVADPSYVPALKALQVQVKRGFFAAEAREILAEAHRAGRRHQDLVDVLKTRLAEGDVGDASGIIHFELARVMADYLGDARGAWPHAVAAYRETPGGDTGLERREVLVAAARRAGQLDALVEELLSAARNLGTKEARQQRRSLDRETLQGQGAPREIVARFWRAILDDDPRHERAITEVEAQARQSGSIRDLADLLNIRAEGAIDDEERRELRGELARFYIENDLLREAIGTLETVLTDQPSDLEAFELLAGIYEQLKESEELADLLERRLMVADADEIEGLKERLAGTWWLGLDDPSRAVEIYGELCQTDDVAPSVVRSLETMWGEGLEQEALFALLAPIYEHQQRWKRLVTLLAGVAESDSPLDTKISALSRKADLERDRLGRAASAYGTIKNQVRLLLEADRQGEMKAHTERLEGLATETNNWTDLLKFYELVAKEGSGDAAFVSRLGSLWLERANDSERAIEAHRLALAREPDTAKSRDALTELLTEAQRWDELAEHLGASAETHLAISNKLEAYRAQARILRGRLGRLPEAVEALKNAAAAGLDEAVYEELAGLLSDLGRHQELQEHYRDWRERVHADDEARRIQVRLALSLIVSDSTVMDAVTELEDVLSADPGDAFALDGLIEVLASADAQEGAGTTLSSRWRDARKRAAEALEAGLEQLGDDVTPAQQAASVRAKLRDASGADRLKLLRQLGDLQSRAERPREAFDAYSEALGMASDDPALLEKVEGLAEQLGLQGRLLEIFEKCYGQAPSGKQRDLYARRLGVLLFQGLGRRKEAASYLEVYAESNGDDVTAMRMLAASYRDAERVEDEARILAMILDAIEGDARVSVGKRLGVLRLDALGDPEGAMAAFDAAMPKAAQDPEIARRLEGLYGKASNFEGLARVYDAALSADPEMEVQLILLAKKAQVHEMRLDNLDVASAACRSILELKPGHGFALTALSRIEEKREDWDGLESVLSQRLPTASNNKLRSQILAKRAEVLAIHLKRPEDALEAAKKADELDTVAQGGESLIAALQALLEFEAESGQAAALLEPRLAARKDWSGLAEALQVQASQAKSALDLVKLAVRTSQIQEAKLSQKEAALDTLAAALKKLLDDEVRAGQLRKQLELTARRCDLWDNLAAISAELSETVSVEQKALYLRWQAGIERDGLEDLDRAIETLERLLEITGNDPAVTAELETLYRTARRSDKLRELLNERLKDMAEDQRPRALLDMAYGLVELEGLASVVPMLEQVLEYDSENLEARQLLVNALEDSDATLAAAAVLEPLLRQAEQWSQLVAVLAAKARVTDNARQRARIVEAIGDTYLDQLESPQKAFAAYARALDDDSSANDILAKLGRATSSLGAWREYTQVLQLVVSREDNPDRKRDLFLQLAQIVEVRLGHVDKAAQIMQAAYTLAPSHTGVVMTLMRLQRKLGMTEEVVRLAETGVENIADSKIQLRLWREVYGVAVNAEDQKLAIRAAEECLRIDPYDSESAERLIPLYEQQHRYNELEELLLNQADGAMDSAREAELMLQLGKLRENALKDLDGALTAYSTALELNPAMREAAQLLDRHYREQERFSELFDLLTHRAESLPPGGQESVATYMEMGRIAEEKLDDLDQAIAAYDRIVSFDMGDQLALDELIRICRSSSRFNRLADLYQNKAGMQNSPAERRRLLVLAAEVYAVRLRNMVKAEKLLNKVHQEDPDNVRASVVLAQIQAERGAPERAVDLLERLLATTTGPSRFDILLNLGRLHRKKLNQSDKALEYLTQARQLQGTHAELNALLSELFQEAGNAEGLQAILESQFASSSDPRQRYEAAVSLAQIASEKGDVDGFIMWVERAQEGGRKRREVVELLIDHHTRQEEWEQVVSRLEWLVNYLEGKRLTAELPGRARQLAMHLEHLGQANKALQYFKLAVSVDSRDVQSLLGLGRLQMASEDWGKALKTHQTLVMVLGKTADPEVMADVLINLAKCCIGDGKKTKAKQYLKRLLSQSPGHEEAQALLDSL